MSAFAMKMKAWEYLFYKHAIAIVRRFPCEGLLMQEIKEKTWNLGLPRNYLY